MLLDGRGTTAVPNEFSPGTGTAPHRKHTGIALDQQHTGAAPEEP